jgi:hypothetical protein
MSLPDDLREQYLKVKEMIQVAMEREGPLPAWVASIQRIMEHAMSRVASEDEKDNEAVARGLASALKFVQQILEEQLYTRASREATSADTSGRGTTSA